MKNAINNTFRERLKALIVGSKTPQKDIAKEVGIDDSTLSGYISGHRNPDVIIVKRIANYFKVSLDYLLVNDDYINGGGTASIPAFIDEDTRKFITNPLNKAFLKLALSACNMGFRPDDLQAVMDLVSPDEMDALIKLLKKIKDYRPSINDVKITIKKEV